MTSIQLDALLAHMYISRGLLHCSDVVLFAFEVTFLNPLLPDTNLVLLYCIPIVDRLCSSFGAVERA